jgi:hypothetical protein
MGMLDGRAQMYAEQRKKQQRAQQMQAGAQAAVAMPGNTMKQAPLGMGGTYSAADLARAKNVPAPQMATPQQLAAKQQALAQVHGQRNLLGNQSAAQQAFEDQFTAQYRQPHVRTYEDISSAMPSGSNFSGGQTPQNRTMMGGAPIPQGAPLPGTPQLAGTPGGAPQQQPNLNPWDVQPSPNRSIMGSNAIINRPKFEGNFPANPPSTTVLKQYGNTTPPRSPYAGNQGTQPQKDLTDFLGPNRPGIGGYGGTQGTNAPPLQNNTTRPGSNQTAGNLPGNGGSGGNGGTGTGTGTGTTGGGFGGGGTDDLTKLFMDQWEKDSGKANAANEKRYGELLDLNQQGLNQSNEIIGSGTDALTGALGQMGQGEQNFLAQLMQGLQGTNAANTSALQGQAKQSGDLLTKLIGELTGSLKGEADKQGDSEQDFIGDSAKRQRGFIDDRSDAEYQREQRVTDNEKGLLQQDMLDRGFGNSTLGDARLRGIMDDSALRRAEIGDRQLDRRLGVEQLTSGQGLDSLRTQGGRKFGAADQSGGRAFDTAGSTQNALLQILGQQGDRQFNAEANVGGQAVDNLSGNNRLLMQLLGGGEDKKLAALQGSVKDRSNIIEGRSDIPPDLEQLIRVLSGAGAQGPAGRAGNAQQAQLAQNIIQFMQQM